MRHSRWLRLGASVDDVFLVDPSEPAWVEDMEYLYHRRWWFQSIRRLAIGPFVDLKLTTTDLENIEELLFAISEPCEIYILLDPKVVHAEIDHQHMHTCAVEMRKTLVETYDGSHSLKAETEEPYTPWANFVPVPSDAKCAKAVHELINEQLSDGYGDAVVQYGCLG